MLSKRNQKEDVEGLVPEDAEAAVHPEPEPEPINEEAVEELLPKGNEPVPEGNVEVVMQPEAAPEPTEVEIVQPRNPKCQILYHYRPGVLLRNRVSEDSHTMYSPHEHVCIDSYLNYYPS